MTVQVTFRGDPEEEKKAKEMVKTMFLTSGAKVTGPKPERHLKLVKSEQDGETYTSPFLAVTAERCARGGPA